MPRLGSLSSRSLTGSGLKGPTPEVVAIGPTMWSSNNNLASTMSSANIRSVAASSSVYIAVGTVGKAAKSIDQGTSWSTVSGIDTAFGASASNITIFSVAYGNNTWVVIGYTGTGSAYRGAYSTDDGTTWNTINALSNISISKVYYLNNTFVCIGLSGVSLYSTNGISWTSNYSGAFNFNGAAFGNSIYVVVGQSGVVRYGSNLNSLSFAQYRIGSYANNMSGVAFGNGKFIAVGRNNFTTSIAYSSTDGSTWTELTGFATAFGGSNIPNDIVFDGSKFIVIGNAGLAYSSTDGTSWTLESELSATMGSTNITSLAIMSINNMVAVGDSGKGTVLSDRLVLMYQATNTLKRSIDSGSTWTTYASGLPVGSRFNYLFKNANNNNLWYAVGETTSYTATDSFWYSTNKGLTWAVSTLPTSARWESGVAASNIILVAYYGGVYVSTNGAATWTQISSITLSDQSPILGYIPETKKFVIGAFSGLWTSTDGTTWTRVNSQSTYTSGGQHVFVKIGSNYVIRGNTSYQYTTNNGATWSSGSTTSFDWRGIGVYGTSAIQVPYTGGSSSAQVTTDSGVTWTDVVSLPVSTSWWHATNDHAYILIHDVNHSYLYRTQDPANGPWTSLTPLGYSQYGRNVWSV